MRVTVARSRRLPIFSVTNIVLTMRPRCFIFDQLLHSHTPWPYPSPNQLLRVQKSYWYIPCTHSWSHSEKQLNLRGSKQHRPLLLRTNFILFEEITDCLQDV